MVLHGTIRKDDFFAQHSIAMLEQCCNYLNQCSNNVETLFFGKSRCCESSRVTSP